MSMLIEFCNEFETIISCVENIEDFNADLADNEDFQCIRDIAEDIQEFIFSRVEDEKRLTKKQKNDINNQLIEIDQYAKYLSENESPEVCEQFEQIREMQEMIRRVYLKTL
jgi:Asp-tRNA(Asn)/Glu-tRNA(Gln) amidotransferase C subunit